MNHPETDAETPGRRPRSRRHLAALLWIAGAAAIAWLLAGQRTPPRATEAKERPRAVRVLTVPRLPVVTRAVGYGVVEPRDTWEAVVRVPGPIVERAPDLMAGTFVAAGDLLVRIDPVDYEIALRAATAERRALEGQLAELATREESLREQVALAEEVVGLLRDELARQRKLLETSSATPTQVDAARRAALENERGLAELRGALRALPGQRARLEAERDRAEARVERARIDLARVELRAPFEGRVASADAEVGEYARQGEVVVRLDGIAEAEVTARIPGPRMRLVARTLREEEGPAAVPVLQERLEALGATVRLRYAGAVASWDARVRRILDSVDPRTRMVGVVVAVADPYGQIVPGETPPLMRGMFAEVELRAAPSTPRLVIPRDALHEGDRAYLVGEDDRLRVVEVAVAARHSGFVEVDGGLAEGDTLVLGDLFPASEGMLLAPRVDLVASARLEARARGTSPP